MVQHASYRELFEANPQPMWVCHGESLRFLAVNEAALRLYGYRRGEFLELSLRQLDPAVTSFDPEEPARVVAVRHLRKDGTTLELDLHWQPLRFEGERCRLALLRTPSEAGRLEHRVAELSAQLEAAQHELETFSYSVSHDLKAPLRHIDGFSRALLDDYGDRLEGQGHEYLDRICQATAKMSQLIDALQQLSRVARGELTRQTVNLSVTAQVISLELKRTAPERRVEFVIEDGVSVEADPRFARQLLEILMGNAWKFSSKRESAQIEFGSQGEGEPRTFFVRDDGAGFDMSYADKLFTVFHRLHRADEFPGSGVGLAIAQRIVARHGGRIWAESAPGAGATFYFTL